MGSGERKTSSLRAPWKGAYIPSLPPMSPVKGQRPPSETEPACYHPLHSTSRGLPRGPAPLCLLQPLHPPMRFGVDDLLEMLASATSQPTFTPSRPAWPVIWTAKAAKRPRTGNTKVVSTSRHLLLPRSRFHFCFFKFS